MAKATKNQKPTYKSSKSRKEQAAKRAAEEAAREKKRKRIKKICIIGAIALSSFILVFSVVSIVGRYVKTYETITINDLYSGSGSAKGVSDKIISLDGKHVCIKGYMCDTSSLANKVIYIASSPGTACPYCYEKYGAAMPIKYANALRTIKYTTRRVLVKGTLEVKTATEADGMETFFRILIDTIEEL